MAARHISLDEAAMALGYSRRAIEYRIRGRDSRGRALPQLPSSERAGRIVIATTDLGVYCQAHLPGRWTPEAAARLGIAPGQAGMLAPTNSEPQPIIAGLVGDGQDLEALLGRVARSAEISNDDKRTLALLADVIRRTRETDAKLRSTVPSEKAVAMLRFLADCYCDEIESAANADAGALLKHISTTFAVDLAARNVGAQQCIAAFLLQRAERTQETIRTWVRDQVAGLRDLFPPGASQDPESAAPGSGLPAPDRTITLAPEPPTSAIPDGDDGPEGDS